MKPFEVAYLVNNYEYEHACYGDVPCVIVQINGLGVLIWNYIESLWQTHDYYHGLTLSEDYSEYRSLLS